MAYGSADGSIGIFSTERMYRTQHFANAHNFSVTSIDIHPFNLKVISGAPDYTCASHDIVPLSEAKNIDSIWYVYFVRHAKLIFLVLLLVVLFIVRDRILLTGIRREL